MGEYCQQFHHRERNNENRLIQEFLATILFYITALKYQRWSLKTLPWRIFVGPKKFIRRHKSWNNVYVVILLLAYLLCFFVL